MLNSFSNIQEVKEYLHQKGYLEEFTYREGSVIDSASGKKYEPKDLLIYEYYRFNGVGKDPQMIVIFAIKTNDGLAGIFESTYGSYSDAQLIEFIAKIRIASSTR